MRGAVSGSLAVAFPVLYITFLVSLVVATRAELTAIREESCFGVAGGLLIRFRRQQSGNCIACKRLCFGDQVMKLMRRKTQ